jgi:hypothetical protein
LESFSMSERSVEQKKPRHIESAPARAPEGTLDVLESFSMSERSVEETTKAHSERTLNMLKSGPARAAAIVCEHAYPGLAGGKIVHRQHNHVWHRKRFMPPA